MINDRIKFTTTNKKIGICKNSDFIIKDINKTKNKYSNNK